MRPAPRRAVLAGTGALGAATLGTAAMALPARGERDLVLLHTYVAGTGYHAAAEAVRHLRPGDAVHLRRRPDSAYDPRTIEVRTAGEALLGHVPRIDNQALARLMDAGIAVRAMLTDVAADTPRPRLRLEIAIALS